MRDSGDFEPQVANQDHPAIRKAARAYAASREWREAESAWRDYLALFPDDPEAAGGLVEALLRQRRLDEADEAASSALVQHPGDLRILTPWALTALARKDDLASEERWLRVLEFHPDSFAPHLHLGTIYQARGDLAPAKFHLLKAQSLQPSRVEILLPLARYYSVIGDDNAACDFYLRHLNVAKDPHLVPEVVKSLLRQERAPEASKLLDEMEQGSINTLQWRTARFHCDIALERWRSAIQYITDLMSSDLTELAEARSYDVIVALPVDALQRKVTISWLAASIGSLSVRLINRLEIEGKFDNILELLDGDPDDRTLTLTRAKLLARGRRYAEACIACNRILAKTPKDVETLTTLVSIAQLACDWKEVVRLTEMKIGLSAAQPEDFIRMADAFTALGDLTSALEWSYRGLQSGSNIDEIQFRLGVIAYWQGDFRLADSYFKQVRAEQALIEQAMLYRKLVTSAFSSSARSPEPDFDQFDASPIGTACRGDPVFAEELQRTQAIREQFRHRRYDAAIDIAAREVNRTPMPSILLDEWLRALLASARTSEARWLVNGNPNYFSSRDFESRNRALLAALAVSELDFSAAVYHSGDVDSIDILKGSLLPCQRFALFPGEHALDREIADNDIPTILVADSDLSFEIVWSRCYRELLSRLRNVEITCDHRLLKLFERSFPDLIFIPVKRWLGADPVPGYEELGRYRGLPHQGLSRLVDAVGFAALKREVLIGSLSQFVAEEIKSKQPVRDAYLVPDSVEMATWRRRLDSLGNRPNVGISWISDRRWLLGSGSTSLSEWLPLLQRSDVNFINVQAGDVASDISHIEKEWGVRIHTFDDLDVEGDLSELASLLAQLDLVVSVTNNTSELAGAVGAVCWIVDPVPFFRARCSVIDGKDILHRSQVRESTEDCREFSGQLRSMAEKLSRHEFPERASVTRRQLRRLMA